MCKEKHLPVILSLQPQYFHATKAPYDFLYGKNIVNAFMEEGKGKLEGKIFNQRLSPARSCARQQQTDYSPGKVVSGGKCPIGVYYLSDGWQGPCPALFPRGCGVSNGFPQVAPMDGTRVQDVECIGQGIAPPVRDTWNKTDAIMGLEVARCSLTCL